jgi:hypothetical protein
MSFGRHNSALLKLFDELIRTSIFASNAEIYLESPIEITLTDALQEFQIAFLDINGQRENHVNNNLAVSNVEEAVALRSDPKIVRAEIT